MILTLFWSELFFMMNQFVLVNFLMIYFLISLFQMLSCYIAGVKLIFLF